MFANSYRGKRVLVTGHTGFKGSWLCEWLLRLGAQVYGYALEPQPHEILFSQLDLAQRITSDRRADIRDLVPLQKYVKEVRPHFVFHLAAQPLVRLSFREPVETFSINVMGTAILLESIRTAGIHCSVVVVTTDKCYENREWVHAYREEDSMGGFDPYSASKGCAELVTSAYRRSFFQSEKTVRLATGRAGNVIGGGDWAPDRIVPDIFRAIKQQIPVTVRNKHSTRPWQHVLEPLSGYLWLGALLDGRTILETNTGSDLQSAFNFGPQLEANRTVAELVEEILKHCEGEWLDASDVNAPHEAGRLNLSIDKAHHQLRWRPTWDFETAVRHTASWYQSDDTRTSSVATAMCGQQIDEYERDAVVANIHWAL